MTCVYLGDIMLEKNGPGSDQHYIRTANPPAHPGAMHAPMPQYFALPDQRRIERVPRPQHLSPHCESIPAITFSVNGYPGVPMQAIWDDTVIVDVANDPVLEEHGFRSIVISLEWPGYGPKGPRNPMHSRIDVRPGGRCITRQNLAREICGLLFDFHQIASRYAISPGWERWALIGGPRCIRVSDIILFSLHYYRNVWVPEFYVME